MRLGCIISLKQTTDVIYSASIFHSLDGGGGGGRCEGFGKDVEMDEERDEEMNPDR